MSAKYDHSEAKNEGAPLFGIIPHLEARSDGDSRQIALQ
jgi:hypothetical protein